MWEVVMESGPDVQDELTPELDAQGRITSINGLFLPEVGVGESAAYEQHA